MYIIVYYVNAYKSHLKHSKTLILVSSIMCMKQLVEQDGINKNPWFRKRSNNGELFLECWSNLWAWVCTSSTNAYKSIHAYYHYRRYIRYIWDTGGAPTIHSHCWKVSMKKYFTTYLSIYKPDLFHGYQFFIYFLFTWYLLFFHLIYSIMQMGCESSRRTSQVHEVVFSMPPQRNQSDWIFNSKRQRI